MWQLALVAVAALEISAATEEMERAVIHGDQATLERLAAAFNEALDDAEGEDLARLRLAYAYANWRLASFHERESKKYMALLRDAEQVLETSIEENPRDAEALALYGTVNGWLITNVFNGMRRGPRAEESYNKAREIAPENPRVAMLQGSSRLFRPSAFGGGVDKAEAELTEALALFEKEPRDKSWPNGGRAEIHVWMGQVMVKKGELDEAREYYDKALELEPEYSWVLEKLLPELEEKRAEDTSQSH